MFFYSSYILEIIKTNNYYSCKYKKGNDLNKFFSNKIRVITNKLKINKRE